MEEELILLSEFCKHSGAEQAFLELLENEGLIATEVRNDNRYIEQSQLSDLEMFTRLHYELSINVEGIDVIRNLLTRMRSVEQELALLKRQIDSESFFNDDIFEVF